MSRKSVKQRALNRLPKGLREGGRYDLPNGPLLGAYGVADAVARPRTVEIMCLEHDVVTGTGYFATALLRDRGRRGRRRGVPGHGAVAGALPAFRGLYARALCDDPVATLDDLREAVSTLEEIERTARRVFGSGYPTVDTFVESLQHARAALAARETPSPSA